MEFKGPIEAALSTDLRGEPYNFSLWDIHTGTQLVVFKGSGSNPIPKCLQIINNSYFITAHDKVVQIWSIFNKKCQDTKLILPSRPSVLCVSPCGNYLIAGISEMIYVWQLHSGNLLAHTQRHYQTISVLRMDCDGTFLFSGGEDGMVLVWSFADLISGTFNTSALNLPSSRNDVGVNEPRFTWQHHNGQITDIYITNGGRCLTSSTDMTLNLYSYHDGKRLHCVTMPSPLWSIVMDKNETFALVGAQDGNIYEIALSSLSLSLINQEKNGDSKEPLFSGHKGKVISLVISLDGTRLVSASVDSSCKTWDIYQRKMLQDIKHQAPLANLSTLLVPESLALITMSQSQSQPPISVKQLKRELYKTPRDGTVMSEDLFEESSTTLLYHRNPVGRKKMEWPNEIEKKFSSQQSKVQNVRTEEPCGDDAKYLKAKIRELYKFAAEKIFKDAVSESLEQYKDLAT